jgi:hypothetical protein
MRPRTARISIVALSAAAILAVAGGLTAVDSGAHPSLLLANGLAAATLSPADIPGAQVGSAFCQGSCREGYGSRSDVAAAGQGIVATYDRLLTYPQSAGHPLFSFVFEELFGAESAVAATAKFARLHKTAATAAAAEGSLGGLVHELYLETDVLPVASKWVQTTAVPLGDAAFEVLFDSASHCCKFQTAVVVFRVGQTDAVLFIGSFRPTFRPHELAGIERAAVTRLGHPLDAAASGAAPTGPASPILRAALLQVQDLPVGYRRVAGSGSGSNFSSCGPKIAHSVARAEADFAKGPNGPFVFDVLKEAPAGTGATTMTNLEARIAGCHTFSHKNADGSIDTYRVRLISFPALGDQSVAFRLDATIGGVRFHSDSMVIRRGDILVMVAQGGLGAADPSLLLELSHKALQRLDRVTH